MIKASQDRYLRSTISFIQNTSFKTSQKCTTISCRIRHTTNHISERLLCSLMYPMICSSPVITYSIGKLSQHYKCLHKETWASVKSEVQYIRKARKSKSCKMVRRDLPLTDSRTPIRKNVGLLACQELESSFSL